jgi:RHH-type transcriptional regulator, rel operon repressor / antitoxin RelB
MATSDSTTLTLRLDPKLRKRLERLAKTARTTKSHLAAEAIRDFVDLQEWQVAEIRKGVGEADRGDFAPPSRVNSIFRKWKQRAG